MCKWILIVCVALGASLSAATQVLAFAGSSREDSLNKELIAIAADLASQMGGIVTQVDLKDYPMPIYNGDLETKDGMPTKAKEFRQLMVQNEVILISSPEYNGSVSALLKNTLDWASRNPKGGSSREAFKGKKFVIMSASPGPGGGARGLVHLKAIIEDIGGTVVSPQVAVPQSQIKSEKTKKELQTSLKAAGISS